MVEVDKQVVAQYYIECELDNIITGENIQLRKDIYSTNIPRLIEALSFTYRMNGVFDYVESDRYRWEERVVKPEHIKLTGMGEGLTEIIYSKEVERNPLKFVDYIKNHTEDRFDELQFRPVPQNRQILILRENGDVLEMLDGSHRFLSMIMSGIESMKAYVGIATNENAKSMIGDAVFLRLRKIWQRTDDPQFRTSIEITVAGMIKSTSNGEQSVDAYWVRMAPNEEVRTAGQRILQKLKRDDEAK